MNSPIQDLIDQSRSNTNRDTDEAMYQQAEIKCANLVVKIQKLIDDAEFHLIPDHHSAEIYGEGMTIDNCEHIADIFSKAFPHFGVDYVFVKIKIGRSCCIIKVHHYPTKPKKRDIKFMHYAVGFEKQAYYPRDEQDAQFIMDRFVNHYIFFGTKRIVGYPSRLRYVEIEFTMKRNMLYVTSKEMFRTPTWGEYFLYLLN